MVENIDLYSKFMTLCITSKFLIFNNILLFNIIIDLY